MIDYDWKLYFSSELHGTSLTTFYGRLEDMGPSLILLKDEYDYVS